MALGPFVRIVAAWPQYASTNCAFADLQAQITMVAGGAIGRAELSLALHIGLPMVSNLGTKVVEAYKEAAAGRGAAAAAAQKVAARRRMSLDEAKKARRMSKNTKLKSCLADTVWIW